ncbi:hypothetical protein AYI69_g6959 [Smittium culicis]|uniref:Uncharacterized protein n=1 Tax=Smittium culicis TaxID=133412 RepID=A0A1R1XV74_9FUNG|nr:hypothetical protein AYI69_g6959 [Smittium culicis]
MNISISETSGRKVSQLHFASFSFQKTKFSITGTVNFTVAVHDFIVENWDGMMNDFEDFILYPSFVNFDAIISLLFRHIFFESPKIRRSSEYAAILIR